MSDIIEDHLAKSADLCRFAKISYGEHIALTPNLYAPENAHLAWSVFNYLFGCLDGATYKRFKDTWLEKSRDAWKYPIHILTAELLDLAYDIVLEQGWDK